MSRRGTSESFRLGIASQWRTCVWNSRAKLHCGNHWAHHSQCTVSARALLGHIRGSSAQMLLSHTSYIIDDATHLTVHLLGYMTDSMGYISRAILFDGMREPRAFYFYLSSLYTLNTHLCAYPHVFWSSCINQTNRVIGKNNNNNCSGNVPIFRDGRKLNLLINNMNIKHPKDYENSLFPLHLQHTAKANNMHMIYFEPDSWCSLYPIDFHSIFSYYGSQPTI